MRPSSLARSLIFASFAALALAPAFAEDCPPLAGADAVIAPGTVLLLGELHGTAEMPAAVASLACAATARGLTVAVGLEIPQSEQARIDRYIAGESARDELLAGDFWQREYQDGRSSAAMADLLGALRTLRARSPSLRVVALDVPEPPAERDRAMATRLAAVYDALAPSAPATFVVTLTGNLHNRLTRGNPFDPASESMGYLFRRDRPLASVRSLLLSYADGTAWTCTSAAVADCGERPLQGKPPRDIGIRLGEGSADAPFSGELFLGPIHASLPAVPRPGGTQPAGGEAGNGRR